MMKLIANISVLQQEKPKIEFPLRIGGLKNETERKQKSQKRIKKMAKSPIHNMKIAYEN